MAREQPVVYRIDDTDRIVDVNDAWSAAAAAGDAPGLCAPQILGRSVWDFVGDSTTRQLYSVMLRRVRTGARPLIFGFRCDTPTQRRLMQMRIMGLDAGVVSFEVRLSAVQDRPPVALLDSSRPGGTGVIRMCSWCKRIPLATGQWVEIEEAMTLLDILDTVPLPRISHGMCPSCFESITGALDRDQHGANGDVTVGPLPPA